MSNSNMNTTAKPLLIADSRGRGLQNILRSKGTLATVIVNPGKGAVLSTLASCSFIRQNTPTMVILCGSICDITYRSPRQPHIRLRYETIDESRKFYIDQVKEAMGILKNFFPNMPIQLTTVIGIDIQVYNGGESGKLQSHLPHDERSFDPAQHRLNKTIEAINGEIVCLNTSNRIPTPWTANVVHARKGKRIYHRYNKLYDGCHLEENTKEEWCNMLILSFNKFKLTTTAPTESCLHSTAHLQTANRPPAARN